MVYMTWHFFSGLTVKSLPVCLSLSHTHIDKSDKMNPRSKQEVSLMRERREKVSLKVSMTQGGVRQQSLVEGYEV